jgi:hypothetical protein
VGWIIVLTINRTPLSSLRNLFSSFLVPPEAEAFSPRQCIATPGKSIYVIAVRSSDETKK